MRKFEQVRRAPPDRLEQRDRLDSFAHTRCLCDNDGTFPKNAAHARMRPRGRVPELLQQLSYVEPRLQKGACMCSQRNHHSP